MDTLSLAPPATCWRPRFTTRDDPAAIRTETLTVQFVADRAWRARNISANAALCMRHRGRITRGDAFSHDEPISQKVLKAIDDRARSRRIDTLCRSAACLSLALCAAAGHSACR